RSSERHAHSERRAAGRDRDLVVEGQPSAHEVRDVNELDTRDHRGDRELDLRAALRLQLAGGAGLEWPVQAHPLGVGVPLRPGRHIGPDLEEAVGGCGGCRVRGSKCRGHEFSMRAYYLPVKAATTRQSRHDSSRPQRPVKTCQGQTRTERHFTYPRNPVERCPAVTELWPLKRYSGWRSRGGHTASQGRLWATRL